MQDSLSTTAVESRADMRAPGGHQHRNAHHTHIHHLPHNFFVSSHFFSHISVCFSTSSSFWCRTYVTFMYTWCLSNTVSLSLWVSLLVNGNKEHTELASRPLRAIRKSTLSLVPSLCYRLISSVLEDTMCVH